MIVELVSGDRSLKVLAHHRLEYSEYRCAKT